MAGRTPEFTLEMSRFGCIHVSCALAEFLRENETYLRAMAAVETEKGEFTVGLSRCLDLLDDELWST